jgi:hypothetical protein
VLASVVVFAGRPTAEAEPVARPTDMGFSVGAPQIWMSPEDADRELDAAAKTNARWMRVHIDWRHIRRDRRDTQPRSRVRLGDLE